MWQWLEWHLLLLYEFKNIEFRIHSFSNENEHFFHFVCTRVHGLILPRKACCFPPVLLVVSGGAAAIPALPVPATAAFLPAAATSVFAPAAMLVTSSGRSAATPLLVPLPLSLCEVRKNTGWQTGQSSGASFFSDKTKCFQAVPTPLYSERGSGTLWMISLVHLTWDQPGAQEIKLSWHL